MDLLSVYLTLKRQPIDSQFCFENVEFIWPKIILVHMGWVLFHGPYACQAFRKVKEIVVENFFSYFNDF